MQYAFVLIFFRILMNTAVMNVMFSKVALFISCAKFQLLQHVETI